jgi:hypothetical protein
MEQTIDFTLKPTYSQQELVNILRASQDRILEYVTTFMDGGQEYRAVEVDNVYNAFPELSQLEAVERDEQALAAMRVAIKAQSPLKPKKGLVSHIRFVLDKQPKPCMSMQRVVSQRKDLIVVLKTKRKNPEVVDNRLLFYDRSSTAHFLTLYFRQGPAGEVVAANAQVIASNFPWQIAEVQAALKELKFVFPLVEG